MRLHYISELDQGLRGGGYSLRNNAGFETMSNAFDARYCGPFGVQPSKVGKLRSAALRRLGFRGRFNHFAPERLRRICNAVTATGALDADLLFFNGFTPWIGIYPEVPYIAWNDCSFADYIRIYHDPKQFPAMDISRIEDQEARWLQGAEAVILRSQHFADSTRSRYGLNPERVFSLGNFSTIAPPDADTYAGDPLFLFMSTDFEGKNGPTVLRAFEKLRALHPEARLAVVGHLPPPAQQRGDGIEWVGFLNPKDPEQNLRKRDILATAACLVHPTMSDASPAVLVEAAYFGCPVISAAAYAIPETVFHGETGFLLNDVEDANMVAEHMAWMLDRPEKYAQMRRATFERANSQLTLTRFQANLVEIVTNIRSRLADQPLEHIESTSALTGYKNKGL